MVVQGQNRIQSKVLIVLETETVHAIVCNRLQSFTEQNVFTKMVIVLAFTGQRFVKLVFFTCYCSNALFHRPVVRRQLLLTSVVY